MVTVSSKVKALLIGEGLVSENDWSRACSGDGEPIETLLEAGDLNENALMEVMGRAAGIAPVDLRRVELDAAVVDTVAPELCRERGFIPVAKTGDVLTIAVSDPFDVLLFDDLKRVTHCHIRPVFSHRSMVNSALKRVLSGGTSVEELMEKVGETDDIEVKGDEAEDIEMADLDGADAPAVKLANAIILGALRDKASDIHIEPGDRNLRVRYRIDGRLRQIMTPPKALQPALSSRLKILAQLDIAERNAPQDGKFRIKYQGRTVDFRISVLPVVGGEKSVIRILDSGSISMDLGKMGFEEQSLKDVEEAIHSPYGMVLVTGPTGSGKSTTLYSCVAAVAHPEVNVTTVEDPVEYRMDGINQVPVNPKRGTTFAGALRSILRQDPDIVLVGEIRDKETADIAIKAALTGHLVLTTLHTNDAAATITRLIDMGIDPFMVSSSILVICAQRLGRRLCTSCKVAIEEPPREELLKIGFKEEDFATPFQLFEPNADGCARCAGGYKGRFPILETLPMTQRIRRMVVEGRPRDDIKAQALSDGMLTLRRVGVLNAMRGVTSVQEILRITQEH
ncbi:MAG: Flp pilus assembly complex ATPase component TadA [Planctomycetes bacterium]|nr:Flp pilus assembly complex ATPase component TadA [Planctomycetota bacterium]